jgi:hypothetical protein
LILFWNAIRLHDDNGIQRRIRRIFVQANRAMFFREEVKSILSCGCRVGYGYDLVTVVSISWSGIIVTNTHRSQETTTPIPYEDVFGERVASSYR